MVELLDGELQVIQEVLTRQDIYLLDDEGYAVHLYLEPYRDGHVSPLLNSNDLDVILIHECKLLCVFWAY